MASRETVEREAREALTLLLAGNAEAALPVYEACLRSGFANALPIGLHLELLESSGKEDMAAALRDLALERGGNIARRGSGLDGRRIERRAEYEALFARGLINSRMIEDYILRFSRAGDAERVAQLTDPERLLRIVPIDGVSGEAVRGMLLGEETDARFLAAGLSVRGMCRIDDLHLLGDPAPALIAALDAEARRYLADWGTSDHPFAPFVPDQVRMKYWGLISRGEGFNTHHIHHRGWATGVYYPTGIEGGGDGGSLCVGRPGRAPKDAGGWPEASIRPEAGMLVLMPSFYTHWTVPLGRPGLRLSVAFDIIRER
jgi:hypothetical protein